MTGRLVKWALELGEYEISYEPRGPIKAQVLTDFIAELTQPLIKGDDELGPKSSAAAKWLLSVDGSSNQRGSEAGVVLEGPGGVLVEQSLKFSFKTSNNQVEYEAFAAGMLLAKEMGVAHLTTRSDSLLVTGQVNGDFAARDPQLARYLEYIQTLSKTFLSFELIHVPCEENNRADLLSKLASCTKPRQQRSVIKEILNAPRIGVSGKMTIMTTHGSSDNGSENWMTPFKTYLTDGILPKDPMEYSLKRFQIHYVGWSPFLSQIFPSYLDLHRS